MFCYECKHALCNPCRKVHDKIPSTYRHKVKKLNKVDRLAFQSELACETHGELFSIFCIGCNCLICSLCVVSTHKGHSFSSIDDVARNAKQTTKGFISQTKTKLEELCITANKLKAEEFEKIETNALKTISNINSMTMALCEIINTVKNIQTAEVTTVLNMHKRQLDANIKNVETLRHGYQNVCSKFEHILKETHNVTFFMSYVKIKQSMDCLKDGLNLNEFEQFPGFDPQTFIQEVFLRIEEKYPKSDKIDDANSNNVEKESFCMNDVQSYQDEQLSSRQSESVTFDQAAEDDTCSCGSISNRKSVSDWWNSTTSILSGATEELDLNYSGERPNESCSRNSWRKSGGRRKRGRRRTQSPDSYKLFVSNIPMDVTYIELKTFFEQFGTVLHVATMLGRRGTSKIAFVTFASANTVREILSQKVSNYIC